VNAATRSGSDASAVSIVVVTNSRAAAGGDASPSARRHGAPRATAAVIARIALGEDADRPPVDDEPVVLGTHLLPEGPVHGIVLQQMRERLRVRDVVDRHELERLVTQAGAQTAVNSVDAHLAAAKAALLPPVPT